MLVRNEMFRRVELFERRWPADLAELSGDDGPSTDEWADAMERYYAEYPTLGAGPEARGPALFRVTVTGPHVGRCARCSTTPRATTTGASRPPSTSTPPTSSAPRSCT